MGEQSAAGEQVGRGWRRTDDRDARQQRDEFHFTEANERDGATGYVRSSRKTVSSLRRNISASTVARNGRFGAAGNSTT